MVKSKTIFSIILIFLMAVTVVSAFEWNDLKIDGDGGDFLQAIGTALSSIFSSSNQITGSAINDPCINDGDCDVDAPYCVEGSCAENAPESETALCNGVEYNTTSDSCITVDFPGLTLRKMKIRVDDGVEGTATGTIVYSNDGYPRDSVIKVVPKGFYDLKLEQNAKVKIVDSIDCTGDTCLADNIISDLTINYLGANANSVSVRVDDGVEGTATGGSVIGKSNVANSISFKVLKGTYDVRIISNSITKIVDSVDCNYDLCVVDNLLANMTIKFPDVWVSIISVKVDDGVEGTANGGSTGTGTSNIADLVSFSIFKGTYDIYFLIGSSEFVVDAVDCTGDVCIVDNLIADLTVNFPGAGISILSVRVDDGVEGTATGGGIGAGTSNVADSAYFSIFKGVYDVYAQSGSSIYIVDSVDCTSNSCLVDDIVSNLTILFPGLWVNVLSVKVDDGVEGTATGSGAGAGVSNILDSASFSVLKNFYDIEFNYNNGNDIFIADAIDCMSVEEGVHDPLTDICLVQCDITGGIATGCKQVPPCQDADGDGYDDATCGGEDCDDTNPAVKPGATEVCNGIDDNCDGTIDNGGDALCNDGLYCNGEEVCSGLAGCEIGTPVLVDDGISCTVDSCDEDLDQIIRSVTDSLCDDGLFCNGVESCDALLDCQVGIAPTINDGVGCTIDNCDEVNDVVINTVDDSYCQDGLWCNGVESCDAVLDCQTGSAPVCNDGISCSVDSCEEGIDLGDDAGTCGADTAACECIFDSDCNDGNSCTDDYCGANLECEYVNNDFNSCDDGFFCTLNDRCNAGNCIADPMPVDDSVGCTVDSCDEESDQVLHLVENALCNDGLYCNGEEVCDALLDCQTGIAPAVDDNVGCTIDNCDEVNDVIINTIDDSYCLDGLWCNGDEYCDALLDCQTGNAPVCNDGISCSTDSCEEGVDVTDDAGSCEVELSSCECAVDSDCDDGNSCTNDVCNAQLECEYVNDDASVCDDGFFCTEEDSCSAGECVSDLVNVDDGISCTVDSCDEESDQILHLVENALCDDGLYCNGAEICNALLGCEVGISPTCDDGKSCTSDSCNDVTDACGFVPIDVDQDTYNICEGVEQDCNDVEALINPGMVEECNFIDDNCNLLIDEGFDLDNDGYTTCQGDCDDTDATINPGAEETCDGVDNNCDGKVDYIIGEGDLDNTCGADNCEGTDTYFDYYCDEGTGCAVDLVEQDSDLDGFNGLCTDCNDNDAGMYPGAQEVCPDDGIDNNCDGQAIFDCDALCDADNDGFFNDDNWWCFGSDCDDSNAAINPDAAELCNGVDDDCSDVVDDLDADADGFNDCDGTDKCFGTTLPDSTPTLSLKPNHYGMNSIWDGCSCEQVLECKPGANSGEYKYGCSGGTVNVWTSQTGWALDCQDITEWGTLVVKAGEAKAADEDTDGDGIIDTEDIDDDNDGIVDVSDSEPESKPDAAGNPKGKPDWWCKKNPSKC